MNAWAGGSVAMAAHRAADLTDVLLRDGADAADVVAVLRAYGEPEPVEVTDAELPALRAAARELREVFAADGASGAAAVLNGILARTARAPRLTAHHGTTSWHLHVDSDDDAPWAQWFLASSSLALAVLLAERQQPPAGLCASPSCGRPFVNTGRGSVRRYCSAACGSRERVAAHRRGRALAGG